MRQKVDITGVDLVKFAQKVYELSVPAGMGFLHYREGALSDEDAKTLVNENTNYPLSMDYVRGRCCKMDVHKDNDGKLTITDPWYDHTDNQLDNLLSHFGISRNKEPKDHGISCNCDDCQVKVR